MELSDADLMDAMVGEAAAAGFDIEFDPARTAATLKRKSLERWDNKGGAIGQPVKRPQ